MPQAPDSRPSTADQASLSPIPGRRLFSRLASPFSSKSRNLVEFYIDLADPHRTYSPGDIVEGSVRLRLQKPLRVTHLVVCLHGFVQVYKNPGSPQDLKNTAGYLGSRAKKSGDYFGNGFASLFEDEVVLCGDGRLAEGSYQFNFELEFPDQDLPSSIEFERGTVSYNVTATLTKPTPIAPTVMEHRRVLFVERIDIAPLVPPRARTITLEPLARKSRAKTQARKLVDSSRKGDSTQTSDDIERSRQSSSAVGPDSGETAARTPSPSIVSFDSVHSSAERTSHPEASRASQTANSDPGATNSSKVSIPSRAVTATMEFLQGGCLRGETIATRVHVSHAKPVRSLYGVIVTLYRHARVDMHPATPLGPTEKGIKSTLEDYYPKSATGLGGLSLSGNGASHTFRKDLAQTIMPLYVDPVTLTAEVHTKVRVPEDAFPTISTVPGGMISFKYYAEIVLDIQGKLTSQDRSFANLGGLAANTGFGSLQNDSSVSTPFGSNIIDTTQMRRDKGVVSCMFEVVIGTTDSGRRKGKQRADDVDGTPTAQETSNNGGQDAVNGAAEYGDEYQWHDYWYNYPYHGQYYGHAGQDGTVNNDTAWQWDGYYDQYHPAPVPLPAVPDESALSEKERVRRHEERLLPSQPPGLQADVEQTDGPSAPYIPEESDLAQANAPAYASREASASGCVPQHGSPSLRAPDYSQASSSSHVSGPLNLPPTDDKQELERRQLEQQSSAPVVTTNGDATPTMNGTPVLSSAHLEPSAPPPGDIEPSYDSHADATPVGEPNDRNEDYFLPKYEERKTNL